MTANWETIIGVTLGLLWVVTAMLGVLVLAALRHLAYLYEKLDPYFKFQSQPAKLRAQEPLPEIRLQDPTAGAVPFTLVANAAMVLVVQTSCRPCSELLGRTREILAAAVRSGTRAVVVVPGLVNAAAKVRAEYQLDREIPVLADVTGDSARVWGIYATPTALLLDSHGRLQKLVSSIGADELRRALWEFSASGRGVPPLRPSGAPLQAFVGGDESERREVK